MGELTQIYSSTASRRHRTWRGRRRRSTAMAMRGLALAAVSATALGVALERIVA